MRSFSAPKFPPRHVQMVGTQNSGKSTFWASNLRKGKGPAVILDLDGRVQTVVGLSQVEIIGPENPMDIAGSVKQIEQRFRASGPNVAKPQAIIVDSITPLFQHHSRTGAIQMEGGGNRAAQMVGKSNVMALLASLTGYGVDVIYIYHVVEGGRDGKGQVTTKFTISDHERNNTLNRATSSTLRFFVSDGRYGVTFQDARNFGQLSPNQPFTIYDPKGNFWAGGWDRVEEIAYTKFDTRSQAEKSLMARLGVSESAAVDLYEDIKGRLKTVNRDTLSLAILLYIDDHLMKRNGKSDEMAQEPVVTVAAAPEPSPEPTTILPPEPEPDHYLPKDVPDEYDPFDEQFPPHQTETVDTSEEMRYGGGVPVADDDKEDFLIYKKKFGKVPMTVMDVQRSKAYHQGNGKPWSLS